MLSLCAYLPYRYLIETLVLGMEEEKPRNKGGRRKTPDDLSDVLVFKLTPQRRHDLMESLVVMALELPNGPVKLKAIQEIFDRTEGRSRQASQTNKDKNDPLLELLGESLESTPLIEEQAQTFREIMDDLIEEAEYTELDEES